MVQIFLPGHSSSLHSNFLLFIFCGPMRYNCLLVCSFRFLYACSHTVIILFLHFISQIREPFFLKTKVEMFNSASTNRNIKFPQETRLAEINEIKQWNRIKGLKCKQKYQKYAQDYWNCAKSWHFAKVTTQGT